jgi:hypothetical protein
VDRRGFLKRGSALLAVGAAPTSLLTGIDAGLPYRQVMLDARTDPEVARRIFEKELDTARKRHPVYVLYYQEESPHLPAYRQAVTAVLRKKGYRGAVISVDIDRHADLAKNNFFDIGGRPYTINASLSAYIDGKLVSFYKTSIRSQIDGTPFSLSYPGIAGVTAGPLGDDVEKLQSRISGFVERTDQAFAEPAK